MLQLKIFAFNMFYVNTYLLYDESGECLIVDPGCYEKREQEQLAQFILKNELNPVKLINTHCHVDHILGNKFILEKYGLKPEIHSDEMVLLESSNMFCGVLGLPLPDSPLPEYFLNDNEIIHFGKSFLQVLFTPGHSPGHITLYSAEQKFIICGDVLFAGSIGRTDLPGGDYDRLIQSIQTRLMILPENVVVHSGHGQPTEIGFEKRHNPFLN
jgi:hydroxyacylglutathione hydrolase